MPLSPDDIIVKNPHIAQRLFEERMLVITAKDSMLHRFNEVGTFIWNLLADKMSINEICLSIQNHFQEFDSAKNISEIIAFLEKLEKKKLVLISKTDERTHPLHF
jgi:hypothetical protein